MYSVCDWTPYLLNERAYTVIRAVYINSFMYRIRALCVRIQHEYAYGVPRRETK